MESPASFGLLVAFSAGLLSFLSPCVLPLVPSYVSFITGLSLEEMRTARRTALVHALLFVLGFSLIFIALGATASVLGRVLFVARVWISAGRRRAHHRLRPVSARRLQLPRAGAGPARPSRRQAARLSRHGARRPRVRRGVDAVHRSDPRLDPDLHSSTADLHRGLLLLTAYSAGLAIPFIVAALAIDRFLAVFARYRGAING